jgi:hypothetical protein
MAGTRTRTLRFKKLKLTKKHPWESHLRAYQRDVEKLPEREAAFTFRRARSIMKKSPKKPKSRFGEYRQYTPKAYQNRMNKWQNAGSPKGKRPSRNYYRKGLYSRPGQPPYYHGKSDDFGLRKIRFKSMRPKIHHKRPEGGAKNVYAWRVGPVYAPSKMSTPVPQLHEYGGTITLRYDRAKTSKTVRGLKVHFKPKTNRVLKYPARPYMRPSAKEARESAARKSPYTLKAITKLGGMKGKRTY